MKHSADKTTEPSFVEEPQALYGFPPRAAAKSNTRPAVGTLVTRIRAGLPVSEFEALRELLDISGEELGERLWISRSTLARRRKSGRLAPDESDRVVRHARLFGMAADVLGGHEQARNWLKQPARALGFATPLVFAETEAGAREVENLLGRIEHGVYS